MQIARKVCATGQDPNSDGDQAREEQLRDFCEALPEYGEDDEPEGDGLVLGLPRYGLVLAPSM